MRRLEAGQPIGRHADQRRVDRLVLAALRRQRQTRRRGHQQEPRVLVAGIDQRIETAVDERIVHRADRQQPRAGHRRRQSRRAQQQEQVLLGDAEFDVLTLRRHAPALRARQLRVAEHVVARVPIEDAAAVHPRPEIGRHRHVGRRGHDVLGERLQLALAAADLGQDVAEARLRGHPAAGEPSAPAATPAPAPWARSSARPSGVSGVANGQAARNARSSSSGTSRPSNRSHSWPGRMPMAARNTSICSLVISPAWLSLWPANGRPMPLIV